MSLEIDPDQRTGLTGRRKRGGQPVMTKEHFHTGKSSVQPSPIKTTQALTRGPEASFAPVGFLVTSALSLHLMLVSVVQPAELRFSTAEFLVKSRVFIKHTARREFHGPDAIQLANGDILMAGSWGRPRGDFEQFAARYPVPKLYRSQDGGRTWREQDRMHLKWNLTGMVSDGGVSFLRLQDGRLAFLAHRHVAGLHGGGLPVISFSQDSGETWTPAKVTGDPEGVWYVMNDRLLQTSSGRLIVPVAHMPKETGTYEGDKTWDCVSSATTRARPGNAHAFPPVSMTCGECRNRALPKSRASNY